MHTQHPNETAQFKDAAGDIRTLRKRRHGWQLERQEQTPALALNQPIAVMIGGKIRARRQELGLSMSQLCSRAGLVSATPKQRIHEIEVGSRKEGVRLGTLYALAAALEVEPTDLMPPLDRVLASAGIEPVAQDWTLGKRTHMTDIATWPFTLDPEFRGTGFGFLPVLATIEGSTSWGYSFVEDPEMNERGYKRTWSGPRGPWNEAAGKSDPYDGPSFSAGQKVRVGLSQVERMKDGAPITYHNIRFIALASPAESDDGDSGAYNRPGGAHPPQTAATASPGVSDTVATHSTPVEINIRLGMSFNNLTHALTAGKTAPISAALKALKDRWGHDPADIWAEWMAQAAEGLPLSMVVPVQEPTEDLEDDSPLIEKAKEMGATVLDDAREIDEQAQAHFADEPDYSDEPMH